MSASHVSDTLQTEMPTASANTDGDRAATSDTVGVPPSASATKRTCTSQLVARLQIRLHRSSHGELRRVRVDVVGDSVVLRGRVGTYYAKQSAQEAVRHLSHPRRIVNLITVVESSFRDRPR